MTIFQGQVVPRFIKVKRVRKEESNDVSLRTLLLSEEQQENTSGKRIECTIPSKSLPAHIPPSQLQRREERAPTKRQRQVQDVNPKHIRDERF
jgi:hypothetical protein